MSVKTEVRALLGDAHKLVDEAEGVAVSELNRVRDGIQHAISAVETMVEPEPKPKPKVSKES